MKNAVKIFGFAILVSAFYSYVGQTVPQKITYPPESATLSADMTPFELAEAGELIVAGKGTCLGCHTIGSGADPSSLRFPDLGGIGVAAADRVPGEDAVTYLAKSMYEPNDFIVEGFLPGMPVINRPPIGLNDDEIKAVIAYLQGLGGEPTITLATDLGYTTEVADNPAPAAAAGPPDGAAVFASYLCNTCHAVDVPTAGAGPSLYDVGARMSEAEIRESIMDPDAVVAEGYVAGVMGATLAAVGFSDKVTDQEVDALVQFLASKTGGS
ncbi:MAG: cytochrome c [Rhodothermales bacterium]|nr:cytochrome c [Rhodothermales bacterium]MBO6778132.1 cytochrome c [Rhodothermales bacterium]